METQSMSSKSSPSKKDEKSLSPTKKDDKASTSVILTRHQSTFLSTRQLRNKDSSRKKISEFTKQLLSPNKDRRLTHVKKKSPKDKKEKVPMKQPVVSINKLELEQKIKPVAKKRKHLISVNKVTQPAKSPRVAGSLSAQELIDMCEEQSLDDEGLMEILTCESPVWWEDPHDFYEGSIFSHSKKRYFQEFFEQIKSEPPDYSEPATTNITTENITIPTVKQSDDKFMKKRNKLENLLGNIKNKLNEPAEDVFKQNIEKQNVKKLISPKAKETVVEESSLEQGEINVSKRIKLEKPPSESTSSEDELFFGFQNEDILKDLENMNIPIESDSTVKENDESNRNISSAIDNNFRENITEDLIAENNKIKEINEGECFTTENYESKIKIETENSKEKTTTHSFFESNNKDLDKNKRDKHNSCCGTKSSIGDGEKNPESIDLNSIKDNVKIYFIDTTSSKVKENTSADSKSKPHKHNDSTSKNVCKKVDKSSVLQNNLKTKEEPDMKSVTKIHNTEDNKTSSTNNDSHESGDRIQSLVEKKNSAEKEKETKPNKSTNIYKDQLMAVYKKITEENYRENLKKTTKNEVKKNEPSVNKIIDTPNDFDTQFYECKTKTYFNKRTQKKPETNGNQINDTKTSGLDVNSQKNKNCQQIHKETNSNEVNTSKENINEETPIKVDKIDTKPVVSNKQMNENKSANPNEVNCNKIKKDDSCGDINSDKANTETSLNITSNVKSAKYCLKCSSIFETELCSYCAKKSQIPDGRKNGSQVPRQSNA